MALVERQAPLHCSRATATPSLLRGHLGGVNDCDVSVAWTAAAAAGCSAPLTSTSFPALLASASDDGSARLWDVRSGRTTRAVRWREGLEAPRPVLCCAFDRPHPPAVLFTAHGRHIAVWDVREECSGHSVVLSSPLCVLSCRMREGDSEEAEGAEKEAEDGGEDEVNRLLVAEDGSRLVACDDSGRWFTWAIQRRPLNATTPPSSASADVPSPAPFRLGTAVDVKQATPSSSSPVSSSPPLPSSFLCASVSRVPHSNVCADVSLCTLGASLAVVSVGFDFAVRVTAVDGSRLLASADVRPLLQAATDTPSPSSISSPSPLTNPPYPQCVAASPVSSLLLIGCCSGQLLWVSSSLHSASVLSVCDGHSSSVVSVRHVGHWRGEGDDGVSVEYFASAGTDRRVAVWRVDTRRSTRKEGRRQKKKERRQRQKQRRRQTKVQDREEEGEEEEEEKEAEVAVAEVSSVSSSGGQLDWTLMEESWKGCAALDARVTRVWTVLHPSKLNCIQVVVDAGTTERGREGAEQHRGDGLRLVRGVTVWACGVSSALRCYHVTPQLLLPMPSS